MLKKLKQNLIFKITSLNAVVISVKLLVSLAIQRLLSVFVGASGIANIGQVRNLMVMLSSTTTLGVFNGVVKYVSEHKHNKPELAKLFTATAFYAIVGSFFTMVILFFGAEYISEFLFTSAELTYLFKVLAFVVPVIALNRIFLGIVNSLSKYKSYAKIDLIGYLLASVLLLLGLYFYNIDGVLVAIAIAPVLQFLVIAIVFGKTLKSIVEFSKFKLNSIYVKSLIAFTLMSFVSTFLLNFIELDIRTSISNKINTKEAGYWTAMTFISKNYMNFATGLFTLYVIPKFANIHNKLDFRNEVFKIYKTILPIFGIGMFLVFILRHFIIKIIYPEFYGMAPLFKWQLLGDFIRLCALVISHQFLAKRLVKSFIFTELFSLGLFFVLTKILVVNYATEGVVMAHFFRYIAYLIVVVFVIWLNFKFIYKEKNR